ncbi:MAG TPA: hypothetical protein VF732_08650, partial [Nitrospira sp.]
MSWWRRFWQRPSNPSPRQGLYTLTMPGWIEEEPSGDLSVWRNSDGDILTLSTQDAFLDFPSLDDAAALQRWCRDVAEDRGAGLIEVREVA